MKAKKKRTGKRVGACADWPDNCAACKKKKAMKFTEEDDDYFRDIFANARKAKDKLDHLGYYDEATLMIQLVMRIDTLTTELEAYRHDIANLVSVNSQMATELEAVKQEAIWAKLQMR